MFSFALIAILATVQIPNTLALIGYDCVGQRANITAISLSRVNECSRSPPTKQPETVNIQLLQRKVYSHIRVRACYVSVSTLIVHCGMHSHTSLARGGFNIGELAKLSQESCFRLHEYGHFVTPSGRIIAGFAVNTTHQESVVDIGQITTSDGACQGGAFTYRNEHYTNVIVTNAYTITLREEYAPIDMDEAKIRMSSGYSYALADGKGFDADFGNLYWNSNQAIEKCSATSYSVLYQGPAVIYTTTTNVKTLLINTTTHAMAIGIKNPTMICAIQGFTSDHPKLFIIISNNNLFYFQHTALSTLDVDIFLYTNIKFVFIENHFKGQLESLYEYFSDHMCQIKAQQLRQLTSLAYVNAEEFAWALTMKSGITALLRGEVIYLIECLPVHVEFRKTSKCYQEIPVNYQNKSMFIKPRSRILALHGREIDCNVLAPNLYNFGDSWIQMNPDPVEVKPPKTLDPEIHPKWAYQQPANLLQTGLYSSAELELFQKRLLFAIEKPAISHIIVSRAGGSSVQAQNVDLGSLLSAVTVENLQNSLLQRIYGKLYTMSVFLSSFSAIIFIILIVKSILNMIINGTLLYRAYGFSYHIASACWNTLAKHCLYFKLIQSMVPNSDPPIVSVINNETELETITIASSPPQAAVSYQPIYPSTQ